MGKMSLRVNTKAKVEENSKKEVVDEELLEPLSPTSEIYFNSEEVSVFILAIFELEKRPIDVTAVYAFLKDDFLATSPRFSSIMIQDKKGKKMWKRVEVNVQDHVKIPNFPEGLSPEKFNKHYDNYLTKISKENISLDRPLWEFHIVKKQPAATSSPANANANANAKASGGGVFIFKFHHAIADGVSLMGALFSCFRRADDPSLPLTFPSSKPRELHQNTQKHTKKFICSYMNVAKFLSSMFYSMYDFGQGITRTFFKDDPTPIRSGHANLHLHSTRICSVIFSLNDVKRIKQRLGVTVNDVVVGTIFLGLHLYMQEMDPKIKKPRSTAIITANARSTKGYAHSQDMHKDDTKVPWGNKSVGFQIPIPHFNKDDALANPLNFVIQPHKTFKRKRTSVGQYLLNRLVGVIMTYGGPKVAARIFYGVLQNSSLAISNMIGPIEQMSLAKHPVNGFYFMLVGVNLSLTVTVMSYMQKLRIGLGVEEDFIDRQKLIKCVENAFELILQAAMATPETNIAL